jgi:hypothetical protein
MAGPRVVIIDMEDLLPQRGAGRDINYISIIQHPIVHTPVSRTVAANGVNITCLVTLLLSLTAVAMLNNKGVPLLLEKDRISKGS